METINYPITQRRLRTDTHIRELTANFHLSHKSFIQPLFVNEALHEPIDLVGLTGVQSETIASVLNTIKTDIANGIHKFLLFPVPAKKELNHFNFSFASKVVKRIKESFGNNVWLAVDVCLCSYTSHGHCGILNESHSKLLNNQTVDVLSKYAVELAGAGADCIAPSDMMDGRIAAIRNSLNAFGFDDVSIMSYSAKFSSQLYGPFRDACNSAPNTHGIQNRKSYQISPFNVNDAIASSKRDEEQGADILMVKPAALYTDIIAALKQQTLKPIAAYHVSGEYASIEAMVQQGFMQREAAHAEVWTALVRSGASMIISYASRNAREWIDKIVY